MWNKHSRNTTTCRIFNKAFRLPTAPVVYDVVVESNCPLYIAPAAQYISGSRQLTNDELVSLVENSVAAARKFWLGFSPSERVGSLCVVEAWVQTWAATVRDNGLGVSSGGGRRGETTRGRRKHEAGAAPRLALAPAADRKKDGSTALQTGRRARARVDVLPLGMRR